MGLFDHSGDYIASTHIYLHYLKHLNGFLLLSSKIWAQTPNRTESDDLLRL